MSDDLDVLRWNLRDLAEEASNVDVYDRVLERSHRIGRRHRRIAIVAVAVAVVAVVGIPAAMAGQNRASGPAGMTSPSPSPTANPQASPSPAVPASQPATPSAAASRTAAAPPAPPSRQASHGDGCPVDSRTLLAVLQSSAVYQQIAPTASLSDVTCYGGYALATTHPTGADSATVVFQYVRGAWTAVKAGTSGYCDGVVPDAIRPHLGRCY